MEILELTSLNDAQVHDLLVLMTELDPEIAVTEQMLRTVVQSTDTHLFAAVDEAGRIAGCASFCIYPSPTGLKATVEDVVVGSQFRGQHLGRRLLEYILDYARRELKKVDIHLTSRPQRVAANELYRSLGFRQRETNAYKFKIEE